jgi:hypothetical protein
VLVPQLSFVSDTLHYTTTPPSSCTAPVPSACGQSSKKALESLPDPCLRSDRYSACPSSVGAHMAATRQTSCPVTWTSPTLPQTSEKEINLKVKGRLWSWTTSEPIWRHTLDMGMERVGIKSKAWMIAIARSISWSRLELWWQESRLKYAYYCFRINCKEDITRYKPCFASSCFRQRHDCSLVQIPILALLVF